MNLYFIERRLAWTDRNQRTCVWHDSIYHGDARRETLKALDDDPSLLNTVRDPYLLTRSVTFLPEVFMYFSHMIISDSVRRKLIHTGGIDFLPVKFEKGLDLPLPKFGDFSFFESRDLPADPDERFKLVPAVPTDHVQPYYEVLVARRFEVQDQYDDFREITVFYGSYNKYDCIKKVRISERMMEKHSIVYSDALVIREDAYSILAPHLALDFFEIACMDTEDEGKFYKVHIRSND